MCISFVAHDGRYNLRAGEGMHIRTREREREKAALLFEESSCCCCCCCYSEEDFMAISRCTVITLVGASLRAISTALQQRGGEFRSQICMPALSFSISLSLSLLLSISNIVLALYPRVRLPITERSFCCCRAECPSEFHANRLTSGCHA